MKVDEFDIEEIAPGTLHLRIGNKTTGTTIVAQNRGDDLWSLWYEKNGPSYVVFGRKDAGRGTTMHAVFAYVDMKKDTKPDLVMY